MKKFLFLPFSIFVLVQSFAQTSPTPYNLSSGTYTFTNWDSINAAGTYPGNMMFHTLGNQNPTETTPANGDWACAYQSLNGCWIKGRATDGVAFRNIGNSQTSSCLTNGSGSVYVGDATVALNTTNCENINVSWIGRMLNSFNYSDSAPITRFYGIACQFRIGTTGDFYNVPGSYLFKCNLDSVTYKPIGATDSLTTILPDSCNNQPVVEIRWIYHQLAENSGGPRPILGLDEINITRDFVTNITTKNNAVKTLNVYPNPIHQGKLTLNKAASFMVLDIIGHTVSNLSYAKEINIDHLANGVYFIKTTEGEIVKFLKTVINQLIK